MLLKDVSLQWLYFYFCFLFKALVSGKSFSQSFKALISVESIRNIIDQLDIISFVSLDMCVSFGSQEISKGQWGTSFKEERKSTAV